MQFKLSTPRSLPRLSPSCSWFYGRKSFSTFAAAAQLEISSTAGIVGAGGGVALAYLA